VYFRKFGGLQSSNFIYFSYIYCHNNTENMNVRSSSTSKGFVKVTNWRSCLRHCATSRKVAVSISDGVIDLILPAATWVVRENTEIFPVGVNAA